VATYPQRWSSPLSPVGFGRQTDQPDGAPNDDRYEDEPLHVGGEEFRCRFAARMVGFAAQRLMKLKIEGLTGRRERSARWINHRNGYRDRVWETRAGGVKLRIPRLRRGSHFHGCSGATRRLAETALAAVVQEAYGQASRPVRSTISSRPKGI
jgi:Transposase, Mutator family